MTKKQNKLLSDVKLFYIHAGLFAFSEIIFMFSLPILFWSQGFSLSFIFAFYALAALPGYFFTTRIVQYILKTSIKKVLILGVIFYILLGAITPFIQIDNIWWFFAFFLLSVQALFYFPARHLYFSEIISNKSIGFQSGVLSAVMTIARTVGPIAAGVIALLTEFNWVFIFGALIMMFSIIPILFMRTKVEMDFKISEFKAMLKHPVFKITKPAYIADGINSIISYLLWPVLFYLFISKNDYFQLSSLMTITYAISAIIMVVVGHFFDQKHRKALLKASVFSNILAIIGRFALLFFHPILFVYGIQSFYLFSESALQSTFEAYWYSYSKKTNTIFFTIHREINYALGRFIIGSFLAIASLFLTDAKSMWPFFLLAIPVVFIYLRKGDIDHYLKK